MSSASFDFTDAFSTSAQMSREISTLQYLVHINKTLGRKEVDRSAALETLYRLSQQLQTIVKKHSDDEQLTYKDLQAQIITPLPPVYFKDQSNLTYAAVKEIAQRIHRDVCSLTVSPLRVSRLGMHGPTFLVDYKQPDSSYHSFVIKKTTGFPEIATLEIYRRFAAVLQQAVGTPLFAAPRASTVDFTRSLYYPPSQEPSVFEESASLRESLYSIASLVNKPMKPLHTVLLSEKITGQNILDFVLSERYLNATAEQKQIFFNNIGSLSMLDLAIGNFERFIALDDTLPDFLTDDLPANLGNAIVSCSAPHQTLFAIDNEIHQRLCEQDNPRENWTAEKVRINYCKFLKHILSSEDRLDLLVKNLIASFKESKNNKDIDPRSRNKLNPFLTDLDDPELCGLPLKQGLCDMAKSIKKHLLPYWMSEESRALKDFIASHYKGALVPLDERLKMFENCNY